MPAYLICAIFFISIIVILFLMATIQDYSVDPKKIKIAIFLICIPNFIILGWLIAACNQPREIIHEITRPIVQSDVGQYFVYKYQDDVYFVEISDYQLKEDGRLTLKTKEDEKDLVLEKGVIFIEFPKPNSLGINFSPSPIYNFVELDKEN
jgi:hypothetical protein